MSVFISYSSKDHEFADRLALALVAKRIKVWLDKWEMQPGDSLLDKIQNGLTDSSYLLVVLSKNSVESEWCKKELNSGLMREIEERKVHIIPIIIDDCKVPVFLREKVYADFRKEFKDGFDELIRPLYKLFSENMGRKVSGDFIIDYAFNWGKRNGFYFLDIDLITWYQSQSKSLLIQLHLTGNNEATKKFDAYLAAGVPFVMREIVTSSLRSSEKISALRFYIQSDNPHIAHTKIGDPKTNTNFDLNIRAVQMGVDNNMAILLDLVDYLNIMAEESEQRMREDMLKFRAI
ncbi:toll/interleukin-1 receptor domain-containing protein [Dyadobacter pollutisoli]|jgi:hypothetical protein|uniref:Toll/interleukin-1 receptor domain-containing protein n=1 Tax=Dyadobacter pollutisoli TaxID=2910158 RepID=A0A9E8N8A7_9BACT|nr:toll/interleukin-1 receptor domain-containing protein [Dyadobacter pollutisoli]WAC11764.1 toll/interleukin-1 receptor domain-containing protein [Dyadobacter pollutisoli]